MGVSYEDSLAIGEIWATVPYRSPVWSWWARAFFLTSRHTLSCEIDPVHFCACVLSIANRALRMRKAANQCARPGSCCRPKVS